MEKGSVTLLDMQLVEALLIASDVALTPERLKECLDEGHRIDLDAAVEALNERYRSEKHAFYIMPAGNGFQIVTDNKFELVVRNYINRNVRARLTYAALETLAVIAYKQPISKPEIEHIRGVNCAAVLNTLLERELISVSGRSDAAGRPLLYVTTEEFLRYFGLRSPADLPRARELDELFRKDENEPQALQPIVKEVSED
ncbi:MAG: SMC-Scp complex subunit ScpB [Candidatus Marinimicrobia bacterium]|nr:SMC-Scp complex subunit ScpB [Candidatus Neomarinimicrobiota bacterium]MDD5709396.1 SMC-Scp complex subunit ScpB [Candidatus Neomarinimicrobiota bacterium]MDX9777234.1 SMC-Scp complex subunit ScpB [bacterium]